MIFIYCQHFYSASLLTILVCLGLLTQGVQSLR
uniref:Uncharacterized protein n=1 Tax=Anguilla anguilla TaxID=7936 RepID=A0A0E9XVI9_ANGAN